MMVVRRLAAALLILLPGTLSAQEDHSGLTRAKYIRDCLMCHNRAAPEGVSPAILVNLRPQTGLTPAAAMPGLVCWRRCATCFAAEPAKPR